MALIRTLHKWFGLVLGLQLVLWAISGAAMTLLDSRKVAGEGAVLPAASIRMPADALPLAVVAERAGGPVLKLRLKALYDSPVYEVTTPAGVRLLHARTGEPIVIDQARARELAVAAFSGFDPVRSIERLERPTLEARTLPAPLWRVEFADADRTALFVSATTGEVLAHHNATYRLWDIFWMIHIMDYTERESFNHPLIVTVGTGAAWLALSGLILLFGSFRRADVSWILDPLSARRRAAQDASKDAT